jgi:ABC-type multidrug transport system permease subunit
MKQFYAMVYARTMEFVRDRGTFFWNLLFPIILVLGFSFAFSGNGNALFKIGEYGKPDGSLSFLSLEQAQFIRYDPSTIEGSRDRVLDRLRRHEIDMVIDFDAKAFWFNERGKSTSLLRRLFQADASSASYKENRVTGEPLRYVDWLVPGVIGMNIMMSCLFGVGFVIVRYRKNGVLKRLKATPVSAIGFVSAQALSRFIIVLVTSVAVFIGTNIFLHFMMKGSWLNLLILTSLGIVSMIALGLVFAARFKSEELANGLMNLVTLPMLALSGVFFSLEGSPPILRRLADFLPLSHVTQGARDIMLEGAGLAQLAPHFAYLGLFSVVALVISAALFKWE